MSTALAFGPTGTRRLGRSAVAMTQYDLGPAWYPVALALVSFPTVWLGAAWHERRRRA
jgi:hypothetical protein